MVRLRLCVLVLSSVLSANASSTLAADDSALSTPEVTELKQALQDADPATRWNAMNRVWQLGAKSQPVLPELRAILQDENPELRVYAATLLGQLRLEPELTVPLLIKATEDNAMSRRGPVWLAAALALGAYPEETRAFLLESISSSEKRRRHIGMAGLDQAPAVPEALPVLIEILKENDPETRRQAIGSLIKFGPDAREAIPLLLQALECDDFHTRYWSCRALGSIGPEAVVATPKLIELMQEDVASVRHNAATALGNIGPVIGTEGIEALKLALNDSGQPTRQAAVTALGKLGDASVSAVPFIEGALKQPVPDEYGQRILQRRVFQPEAQAAKTLWLLKPESPLPLQSLMRELSEPDCPQEAAVVLAEIGAQLGAVQPVIELLESDSSTARMYAAEALGGMGAAAADAVKSLEALSNDPDEEVRLSAANAIELIQATQ